MTSLVATTKTTKTKSSKVSKVPTLKYFFGNSGYNITVMDNLTATGKVTKENLTHVLKNKELLLAECQGDSLVISMIASNGLSKNIGYFNSNVKQELFDADAEKAYKVIKENDLILAVSNEDFIDEWTA